MACRARHASCTATLDARDVDIPVSVGAIDFEKREVTTVDKLYGLGGSWATGEDEGGDNAPARQPYDMLAERLSDLTEPQLRAMRRTVKKCMALSPELMAWLGKLVTWERARRDSDDGEPLPVFEPVERIEAIFALTALAAEFRAIPAWQLTANAPLVRLFEAARGVAERMEVPYTHTLH